MGMLDHGAPWYAPSPHLWQFEQGMMINQRILGRTIFSDKSKFVLFLNIVEPRVCNWGEHVDNQAAGYTKLGA